MSNVDQTKDPGTVDGLMPHVAMPNTQLFVIRN